MIFPIGSDKPEIHPTAFVHPSSEISGKVKIGPRVSIWGGCILRGDVDWITIGEESNVQDGTVMHTSHNVPTIVDQGVTIAHRAIVHGAHVKSHSLIGMGAILMDNVVIEENCLVGGGAVVGEKKVIPKGYLALGVPAKPIRPLTPEEIKMVTERAGEYYAYSRSYQAALKEARLI
jgi:carbonic anhydrase/acetyltransferase-like protein (isoleucine patch superfamily)